MCASKAQGYIIVPCWVDDGEVKPIVSDDGRLAVSLDELNIDLDVRTHGFIDSSWQKNPLIFGFSAVYHEKASFTCVESGTNTVFLSTVPAGEIWIVTAAISYANSGAPDNHTISVWDGGNYYHAKRDEGVSAYVPVEYSGWIVLAEGDSMYARYEGCNVGNVLNLHATGFKMDVDL